MKIQRLKQYFTGSLFMLICAAGGVSQTRGHVTAREKKEITEALAKDKNFQKELKEYEIKASDATKTVQIKKIKLNGDASPEFLVVVEEEHLCGALANCPNWVYRKTDEGSYSLLLYTRGRELLTEKTSTGGFRNLRSEGGGTATESYFSIYKYDGTSYRAKDCFKREESGGNSKPKTTRIDCRSLDDNR